MIDIKDVVRVGLSIVTGLVLMVLPVSAQEPGDEVLRLVGLDEALVVPDLRRDGQDIVLSLDDLMDMPATSFDTETIWTTGVRNFKGVSFADFFAELGLEPQNIWAWASNEYLIEIPAEDMIEGGALIAYAMDGRMMRRRDKGPLWVVYPYDDNEAYRSEVIYARSIWQMDRIEFDFE